MRYAKNINVIGRAGQSLLSGSSILVIGCGALGGHLAMLLAGSGVGRIGVADFDTVDISNLQRQLYFTEKDAGLSKSKLIAERMRCLNSEIEVVEYPVMINKNNADEIFPAYDFIVDATDNPSTKYFTDRYAKKHNRPCCIGGVAGWRGQIIILCSDETAMRYSDIFPAPNVDIDMLPCEIEGVMGPAASVVASIQCAEVIKWIISDDRSNRMISLDLSKPEFNVFKLE